MAISSIIGQPATYSIQAAYRKINITVVAGADPVVYCDVYFNDLYYKTISSTVGNNSIFSFDIQDAAQEYLGIHVPGLTATSWIPAATGMVKCYCRLRGSSYGSNFAIIPEGPVPLQSTLGTNPVAGGGTLTNTFHIVNATIQHEQNMDLATHLQEYKFSPIPVGPYSTDLTYGLFPLSHARRYDVTQRDYGYFPVCVQYNGFGGQNTRNIQMKFFALLTNGNGYQTNMGAAATMTGGTVYHIPTGPASIEQLTPGLNWSTVQWYCVVLYDVSNNKSRFATPPYYVKVTGCKDRQRLWYINSLGHFDQLNFVEREQSIAVAHMKSERPLGFNPGSVYKNQTQLRNHATNSNERGILRGQYPESYITWLREVIESPVTYLEWLGIEGQVNDLLPIRNLGGEMPTRKIGTERYIYDVAIEYELANPRFVIRN